MPEVQFSERKVSPPSMDRLIPLMKKATERKGISINPELAHDPHFWYLTARSYATHSERILQASKQTSQAVGKDLRKNLALVNAVSESNSRYTLEQLAAKDPLTGAANRRAMSEYLLKLLQHPRPDSLDIVVMLDIDNFKSFNDEYGHLCGDAVLINLVKLLNDSTRGIDLVGRFGGEEFLLVMPERATYEKGWEEKSIARIEKIRQNIENNLAAMASETSGKAITGPITASFGMIALGQAVKSRAMTSSGVDWVYEEVDHYLSTAKKSGKNKVESPLLDHVTHV